MLAARATHIVGGDVTYQHLSQKEYRVTLHLYIDCINGTAGAINLDTVANISYFDAKTDTLLSYDPLSLLTRINVEKVNYKCLKAEPNACVQQFTFSYVKIIEPGSNGVIIAFQRCCRNKTITNLINPEDVGATFFALVPPSSLVSNNSSTVFKNLPPNFLCTNAPHTIELRSTDTAKCATNDTITKEIYLDEIEPATEGIVLYNVFTPGDDEHNKCFTIDIEKADCINLRYAIYNRWGELVYEGNSVSDCWNGTDYITGKDVPEGEYFGVYLFKINGEAEELRLSNVISLLRG